MKKISKYLVLSMALVCFNCTEDFEAINTNPNATSAAVFNPNFLLSRAQADYSQTGYSQLLFQSMWSQVLASTFSYYGNGDKYVASGSFVAYQSRIIDETYGAATKVYEMQNLVKEKPEWSNLTHIGTIMKVLCISKITDVYGDVPYSEALKAKEGFLSPKYDSQQAIYTGMLTELEAAIKGLDAAKLKPTADLFYGGDIAKWKKFGNSLMLRLAMRLVKVDAANAKTWAEKAAAGGTFESVADNAKVLMDNGSGNGNNTTGALRVPDDYREVRWSKTFMDYLKATKDPRITAIAEISKPGYNNNTNQDLAGDNSLDIQIGLPNGYDLNGGATDISKHPEFPGQSTIDGDKAAPVGKYSRPRTSVFLDRSGANFVLTYAETQLLLAEAKVRGYSVGAKTASEYYADGVQGAIATLAQFNSATGADAAIKDAVTASVAFTIANPLDVSATEKSLQQINEQYWLATGTSFNFIENWSNWRRSGYPVLKAVTYPGGFSNGTIPRRVMYGAGEPSINPENYAAAVAKLAGGDTFTARVWWDK
jgi:Starch-binding associating with outer membrane